MKDLALIDEIDRMDKVAKLWYTGERNPTVIARHLGMRRADVLNLIDEWKAIIHNDEGVKERAKESLYEADNALNMVIKRSWETVEQADDAGDLKTKATLLKNVADIEVKRVEMLQKAGLYDDAALGDELAEMEEKQAILISILKEVTADCSHCKIEVARRLSRVTGKAEPIVVEEVKTPST